MKCEDEEGSIGKVTKQTLREKILFVYHSVLQSLFKEKSTKANSLPHFWCSASGVGADTGTQQDSGGFQAEVDGRIGPAGAGWGEREDNTRKQVKTLSSSQAWDYNGVLRG
jgi:hypothetical protein